MIFLLERESKPRSGDNESRKRRSASGKLKSLQESSSKARNWTDLEKTVGRVPTKTTEALREGLSVALQDPPKIVRRTLIPRQATQKENFEPWLFSSCDLLLGGSQESR